MKRIFSIALVVCMLAAIFAVPAAAYAKAQEGLWPSVWHANLNIGFEDATASPLRPLSYTQATNADTTQGDVAEAINPDIKKQSRLGALYITNNGKFSASTRYVRNVLEAGQPDTTNHNFVTAEGSTIDFGIKLSQLPKLTDEIMKVDADGNFTTTGISSTARGFFGRYLGFNLTLHSVSDFINPDGTVKVHTSGTNKNKPYSTEYNLSIVAYDNEKLGTNAAIIFISGSATGFTSWTTSVRNVYFCNLNIGRTAKYHRFTLTTDYSAGLEGKDMVTLYIDGKKATTFEAPAYRGYNATLGDSLSLGLYNSGYHEPALNGFSTMAVSLDQLSVYGTALTPKGGDLCVFNEDKDAPIYPDEYKAALDAAKAMDSSVYSKKSWQAVEDVLKRAEKLPAVDEMNKENVTQKELDEIVFDLNAAIENLKYNDFNSVINERRFYLPFSFFSDEDPTGYAYAWTNATILFTNPDYDISKYMVNGSQLTNFTSVVYEQVIENGAPVADLYEIKAIYPAGTAMNKRTINQAPENGFITYTNVNVPGTSSSRYASQLFGDNNGEILAQLQVGKQVVLENVTLNDDAAATLQTSGEWLSRYDPDVVNGMRQPTNSGSVCDDIMVKYPYSEPTWRDVFNDFSTLSALVLQLPVSPYLDEFNQIKGKIDTAVETDYTPKSWEALQKALAKVDLTKEDLTQDMIDEWTEKLTKAYEGLDKVEIKDPGEEDSNNPGAGEDTGDTDLVLVSLAVIGFVAIVCMAVLVIGRRRGNF